MGMKHVGIASEDWNLLKEHLDQIDLSLFSELLQTEPIQSSPTGFVIKLHGRFQHYYLKSISKKVQTLNWLQWIRSCHIESISVWDFLIESGSYIYILERHVTGYSLEVYAQTCTLNDLLRRLGECAESIHRCHEKGILHLDLKAEHFIISDNGITLIDFNTSRPMKRLGSLSKLGVFGTEIFAAPECHSGLLNVNEGTDLYSFCLMSLILLQPHKEVPGNIKQMLFEGIHFNECYRRVSIKQLEKALFAASYVLKKNMYYNIEKEVLA